MYPTTTHLFTPLAKVAGLPLRWAQIKSWPARYEMRAGLNQEYLVAIMEHEGTFKMSVEVRAAQGTWDLARTGIINLKTRATADGASEPTLVLDHHQLSGSVTLQNRRVLKWQSMNFCGSEWAFIDPATNRPMIEFKHDGFLKSNATIRIHQGAATLPDLMPLISLGWYQILLHIADSAALVAVTG